MAATIGSLVSETKRNRLSLIGPLTEEEVLLVWEKVAQFVETLMLHQKGVSVSGLGTFTFSKRRMEVGNSRVILIQRPVFVLSEKFKQTHSLHCVKKHSSGQIPLHTLNYTQLSNETGVSRELVEGAVREVLQALSRAVAAKKSVEFDLKDVGRLTIHDGKAKMSFFREFVLRLDGCCDMERVFLRTGTADSSICSIMSSSQSASRPSTTLSLPRIVQPLSDGEMNLSLECSGGSYSESSLSSASPYEETRLSRQLERDLLQMATISEEDEDGEERDTRGEGVCTVDKNGKLSTINNTPLATASNEKSAKRNASPTKLPQPTLIPKPAMLLVGSRESPKTTSSAPSPRRSSRAYSSLSSPQRCGVRDLETQTRSSVGSSRRSTTTCSGSCSCSLGPTPHVSRPLTCSHKSSTGQELCYLCHQRALRNVPVDLSKEKADMEKLYNDTVHDYQHRSELLAMARTQANKTKKRLIDQEMASFNQTVADSAKKQKQVKSSKMDPSYIFCDRMATPAPQPSQRRYCQELDSQVEKKVSHLRREEEEAAKSGREEQERLAKELAACEELYRRMKAQTVEDYKAALNEQVVLKLKSVCQSECDQCVTQTFPGRGALPLPHSPSSRSLKVPPRNTPRPFTPTKSHDSEMTRLKVTGTLNDALPTDHTHQKHQPHPVFGVRQTSPETSEKERAKAFFLDQLATAEEKQRRAREKALKTLQEESEVLRTTKEGLRRDLRKEQSRRVQTRQVLEEEWLASMREKQRRLLEDVQRARKQGIRLHQQCERYQRCKQCQRKRQNMGKSNILHETRYVSGSRLMV